MGKKLRFAPRLSLERCSQLRIRCSSALRRRLATCESKKTMKRNADADSVQKQEYALDLLTICFLFVACQHPQDLSRDAVCTACINGPLRLACTCLVARRHRFTCGDDTPAWRARAAAGAFMSKIRLCASDSSSPALRAEALGPSRWRLAPPGP